MEAKVDSYVTIHFSNIERADPNEGEIVARVSPRPSSGRFESLEGIRWIPNSQSKATAVPPPSDTVQTARDRMAQYLPSTFRVSPRPSNGGFEDFDGIRWISFPQPETTAVLPPGDAAEMARDGMAQDVRSTARIPTIPVLIQLRKADWDGDIPGLGPRLITSSSRQRRGRPRRDN
jgi:hypothetical protein